jgi:arylsulfatase A-like enzyme
MPGPKSRFLAAGGIGLFTGLLWFLLEMTARFAYDLWAGHRPPADYLLFLGYYALGGFVAGSVVFLLQRILAARRAAVLGTALAALLAVGALWSASRSGIDPGVALRYLGAAVLVGTALALLAWSVARYWKRFGTGRLLAYGGGLATMLVAGHLVFLRATALEGLLDGTAASGSDSGRPNVLLVTIDTLRADRLHAYGYPHETSPNMDRLAREGALFEQAVAHSPWTQPSFASLLTSTYPSQHGAYVLLAPPEAGDGRTEKVLYQSFLQDAEVTLAEILLEQGYATLALQPLCTDEDVQRFDQGFEVYLCEAQFLSSMWRRSLLGLGIEGIARLFGNRGIRRYPGGLAPADVVYRSLRALITRDVPRPFFLWVNFRDPHSPYLVRRAGVPIEDARVVDALGPEDAALPISALSEAYDGEIRFVDHYVGRVLDLLRERGILDETVVVLTADHGEEFEDHFAEHRSAAVTMRGRAHGHSFYSELLHVPLMIRYPPKVAPDTRIASLARHVDLLPTVLDLAGVDAGPSGDRFEGRSLLPLITHGTETEGPRLAYSERNLFGPQRRSIQDDRYKLILEIDSGRIELYDLAADPGERRNLAAERKQEADRLLGLLEQWSARMRTAPSSPEIATEDADALEQLRALGYVQ